MALSKYCDKDKLLEFHPNGLIFYMEIGLLSKTSEMIIFLP
jgi:hypothetical protein